MAGSSGPRRGRLGRRRTGRRRLRLPRHPRRLLVVRPIATHGAILRPPTGGIAGCAQPRRGSCHAGESADGADWPGAGQVTEARRSEDHDDRGDPNQRATTEDLLHGGSGEQGPPDGPTPDQATDDLLNGGSGEDEPPGENEPPIKVHDGQVYGG